MDGIFCNNCGAELDEAPTLLPEQRSPCPSCGSLARRFERTISDNVLLGDGGVALEGIGVTRSAGSATLAHAQTAEATGTAYDARVRITDHLVVARRFLRWSQLIGKPGAVWLAEVLDESGEVIDSGAGDNQDDALLAIIESLRPPDPA